MEKKKSLERTGSSVLVLLTLICRLFVLSVLLTESFRYKKETKHFIPTLKTLPALITHLLYY